MKNNIAIVTCLSILVSVFVSAFVFEPTAVMAQGLKKVKVTASRNSILILYTQGPKDAGIFKKHGIDLEIDMRPFKGHMAGLPAGEVPCTTYAGTAAIARINKGLDWVIVGGGLTVMQEVFVLKNSPIKTITDLKGKKFASWSTGAGAFKAMRATVMDGYGMDVLKDTEFVQAAPPALLKMLDRGQIDSMFNNLNKKILKIKKIFFNKPDSEIVEKKYLSPWEKFNGHYDSISTTDKIYSLMSGFINRKGKNIYKSKCQSCHGSSRQGFYESESSGDKYYPSLIGVSFTKKSLSLKNMKTFENSHRYNENKINITEDELSTLKTFFNEYDNILKKFNLLREYGRWQLFLDKNKLPASSPPWGKITAINIDSGEINWSIPFGYRKIDQKNKVEGDMSFGGILTTAGDIFFATGTPDEFIRGYNSINGNELWKYKLPVAGSASPMTYFYKDYQYIIVNVTGGRFHGFPNKLGDYVFAFRINKNKI